MNTRSRQLIGCVLLILIVSGCGRSGSNDADIQRAAIEKVLITDKAVADQAKSALAQNPSAGDDILATMCNEMQAIDLSQSPSDFREAYVRHYGEWRMYATVLRERRPSGFWAGFMHGLNDSLSGESLADDDKVIKAHEESLHQSWTEVLVIAAKNNAKVPPAD